MGALMRKAIGVAACLAHSGRSNKQYCSHRDKQRAKRAGGYRSDGAAGDKAGTREEDSI